ncbi:acyl-CoA dehydrogenase family protein [Nocardia amikacinitolerans]|uniref:acyl-CoA dehydrogenase family protein n=1 Tax=Nocardia amikacinitolerans TaxID=756689 RepID=UPI0036851F33
MSTLTTPAEHLLYSTDEDDLRAAVREFLTAAVPVPAILARIETEEPYDISAWSTLAYEIGAAGLPIADTWSGAGASWREAGVVAEEIGRAIAPLPYLGSAVLATAALLALTNHRAVPQLLTDLAVGRLTATLAVPVSTAPTSPDAVTVTARRLELTGNVTSVADLFIADLILVPSTEIDGTLSLYAVDSSAAGVVVTRGSSLDLTRPLSSLRLDSAPGTLVAHGHDVQSALDRALTVAAAMLACEQVGITEYCLESTVAYAKTRYQFGRQVGSYQAIKHRLADMHLDLVQARAVARYAASCVAAEDPDTAIAVSVAQAFCSRVALRAAEEALQLHGGIGFTWEHPAHLYLKRAKADQLALGTVDAHQSRLAGLVGLSSTV